jgi:hypothetical protein
MSSATTRAPSRAACSATAPPIPTAAPVTTTTRSLKRMARFPSLEMPGL